MIVERAILDEDDVGAALAERIASFAARYNGYRTQRCGFFILVPRGALAWSRFPHDATRWTFDAAPDRAYETLGGGACRVPEAARHQQLVVGDPVDHQGLALDAVDGEPVAQVQPDRAGVAGDDAEPHDP